MRCVWCRADSNYRERVANHGLCKSCRRRFAFEPKRGDKITDLRFKAALDAVSGNGRLSWTDDHLYYEVWRRIRRRKLHIRLFRSRLVGLARSEAIGMLNRWIRVHGPHHGRLEPRTFERRTRHPDLDEFAAYGFERLLVCDRDDAVDVLLANGFHTRHRCPVLSYRGYPGHAFEALRPILRARPPTLIVVHDADWPGCLLAARVVREAKWFGGVDVPRVVDMGLGPRDARRFRGLYLRATPDARVRAAVHEKDAEWLDRYRLQLAAIRPNRLLSTLGRAVWQDQPATGAVAAAGAVAGGAVWMQDPWGDSDDDDDNG